MRARRAPTWLRYMLAAAFFFSIMSVFARMAGTGLPSIEVVFGRAVVTTLLSYAAIRRRGMSPWGTRRGLLFVRGAVGFVALSCFFYAVTKLPLADVTVIHFTSPVFTVFIAGVVLGEGLRKWEVVPALVSLLGIVLVARPGFLFGGTGLDPVATGAAVCGALLAAVAYVIVRDLGRTEDSLVIVFWFSFISLLGSLPFTVVHFVRPQPWELAAILAVGISTQLGQVLITRALIVERAGKAMQAGYVQILFAALWGWVFFKETPHVSAILGALVIVGGLVALTWPRAGTPHAPETLRRPFAAATPPPQSRA